MQSPFQEHFNTNYVPTDAEIERIRAHLAPHDAELARLESLIHELSIQRDRVKDYIGPHMALISHPRRLPQEIVEEIFLDCLPTDHNAIMSAAEAPLLLGRICSAWRSIAFGMPRLWNTLHIPLPFIAGSQSKKAALSHWLERSASLPLALMVIGAQYPGNIDTLHSLLRFFPRLSALHVSKIRPEDFSMLAGEHAPLLTEIHITFAHAFDADSGPGILASNIFRTVNPARITISGEGLNYLDPGPAGWHSQELSSQAAYRLLRGCKNLISLHFSLSPRWDQLGPWSNESLVLPSLESLIIEDIFVPGSAPSEDCVTLLSHLLMPHLRLFDLRNVCVLLSGSTHEIFEHLAKHSPTISDLSFGLSIFTRKSLLETLHFFPVLAKLDIWSSAWLEDEVWKDFVEKQVEYETSLRQFHLTIWTDRPPADVKLSLARGLKVSIIYSTSNLRPTPWEGI
ncbi:hypothetical protein B0H13DRAFT_2011981 [Mycena leptocephala]|nr:hypothetical protein B0H13DRAFT_2011981 [Mycena leptocephala]